MVKFNDTYLLDIETSVLDTAKVGYVDHTVDTRFSSTGVKRMYLNANSVTVGVGVFTVVPQQPGKSLNQTHNELLAWGDNLGFDNPQITIKGVLDLSSYSETTGLSPLTNYSDGTTKEAYIINLKLLQQIYKSGHIYELVDRYNYDEATSVPSTPVYRAHTLTGTFPEETISTIKVMCSGFSWTCSSQTEEGAAIYYTLTFREVRQ